MNTNIEIINPHLWAVRFSWLPWISDITIERNPDIPPDRELARTTKEGILILNADFQHYEQAKAGFLKMQKTSLQDLNESWEALHSVPNKTAIQTLVQAMLVLEIDRRNAQIAFEAEHPKPKQPLLGRVLKYLGLR